MNMNNVKYIVIGVVVGLSIGNANVIASEVGKLLNVVKVDYDIIVDGEKLDTTVLNMDGRSYLNLRDIAQVTKTKVEWNSGLSRVEIGEVKVVSDDYIYFRDITKDHPNYLLEWDNINKSKLSLFKLDSSNNKNLVLSDIPYKLISDRVNIPTDYYKSTLINYLK